MTKRNNHEDPENRWMDTYGDMVTLLLCFFVLMFSISNVDAKKWEVVVKSLNPESVKGIEQTSANVGGGGGNTNTDSFDQIYYSMKKYAEDNNLEGSIEVKKGKDFTFIVFRNNIFFDGDSYILRPEGKKVLDVLCQAIQPVSSQVGEIRIMGHTNQADPNKPNPIEGDRFLSSNRATEVLVYMQEKNLIEPKKLISMGYGQHYPIASYTDEADRAQNRRVEMYIANNKAANLTLDQVYSSMEE